MSVKYRLAFYGLFLLSGCEKQPSTAYFPLAGGLEWEYAISKNVLNEMFTQKSIIRSLKSTTIDKRKLYPQVSASGKQYYFYTTKTGLFRHIPKSNVDNTLFKFPLEMGTEWSVQTRLFIFKLPRNRENEMQLLSKGLELELEIAGLNETVQTKAGRFANCMRIDGVGFLDIPKRLMLGVRTIKVEDVEWYCKGIGLVKKQRKEYALPNAYLAEYSQELVHFKR